MQLTSSQLKKFQALYFEHFSIKLSEDEAREKGQQLLTLYKSLVINRQINPEKECNYGFVS